VSALTLGLLHALAAGAGVHLNLLTHDQTVLHQLADVLAGVGEGNFVALIRVNPDATLSALQHSSSQSLLQSQECHESMYMLLIN
jgi:ABC-type microcin C transport system duplicated ATPase subunit YejF